MSSSPMDEYRVLMDRVESPSSVHEGILSEIERIRRAERYKTGTSTARPEGAVPRGRRRRRVWLVAAGACALVVAAALIPFSGGILGSPVGRPVGASQSFSILAYASETRTLVPPTEDGMIVFDRSGGLTMADKDWYLQYGKYTGCMFTVQGEGIVRIQATTTAGMFYRNSYETVNERDDPERIAELERWKPSKAGLGEYYGQYENVRIMDGFGDSDPAGDRTVQLTKMLGSTIDLPISPQDDSDAKSFGLWTNADYGDVSDNPENPLASADAVLDTFEEQAIVVTAYFEDGSCATQTIELHAADFKATMDDPLAFYGYGDITIYPEIVDRATLPNVFDRDVTEHGAPFALHSLYGVIVDENDGPHPYPLDHANEWLNDTMPFVFERADTFSSAGEAVLSEGDLSDPEGRLSVSVPATLRTISEDTPACTVEVSNLHMARSATLPFGLAPEDTIVFGGYQGDLAYANQVSEQRLGYRIEDDGSLTSGFSYRTVTFDVTNPGNENVPFDASLMGNFAKQDDAEGHYSVMSGTALWTTGYDVVTNSGEECTLAPGETRELSVVYVVPDEFDGVSDPLFLFSSYRNDSVAFRVESLL